MALNSIRWSIGDHQPGDRRHHCGQARPSVAYALDLVTFAATIYAVYAVAVPPPECRAPSLDAIRKALRYAKSRQELLDVFH